MQYAKKHSHSKRCAAADSLQPGIEKILISRHRRKTSAVLPDPVRDVVDRLGKLYSQRTRLQ